MLCANCQTDNLPDAAFCNKCGAKLLVVCASCGLGNPSGSNYCRKCGTKLSSIGVVAYVGGEQRENREVPEGERRHLTVLFCDLVGSTEIASHLDPEEWRELVAEYHRAAARAIEHFGGRVAQYLGDGVMAYFGWPEAHDNDAERATRAGLGILDAISKLDGEIKLPKLAARIGIDSGAVVVGTGVGGSADVFGDTPNIAARVQAAAVPGTVLLTENTQLLVSGLFVIEDGGAHGLKGIERPIHLYRVLQPSGVRGRFEAAVARGLTPFVGREDELRSLTNRWERAREGEGQTALIIGEAGIGKSRLVQHFHEQIAGTPHTWVEAVAGPFFQNTPFHPVAEMLRGILAWRGEESAEEQFAQLEDQLARAGLKPIEAMPLITPLLNPSMSARLPSPLSPEEQRRRLLATLVDWIRSTGRVQPTVVAIEDLHWADPSTLELLKLLVEQGATAARLLLLCTARPEFHAPWPMRAHHTQITLNRLSLRDVRTMVEDVAAQKALSREMIAALVERTGGVPLFVEEMTRAVLESGNRRLAEREIPATLHDSLMSRLDRLGPAKDIIQVGAVIGNEFSYELLHAVYPLPEADLLEGLRRLADAELIHVHGIAPGASYLFKHALIRDAAYEALLRSRRKELHRLVARTIDEQFTALKDAHPEVLASHWTEAAETNLAIAEWSRAGKVAETRNAFREALVSYRRALTLLNLLPESSERDLRKLEFRHGLVRMFWVTEGYGASETIEATKDAAALAEKTGNLAQLVNLIVSKGVTSLHGGDLTAARTLADQALDFALRECRPTSLGMAHALQIYTRFQSGDLAGVEQHFIAGQQFFDDPGYRQHPGATSGAFGCAALNAWLIGRFDVARVRVKRMLAAADGNTPFEFAYSTATAANVLLAMEQYEQAEPFAEQALELSEKDQFPLVAVWARCLVGRVRAELGRSAEGIELIRQGIAGLPEVAGPGFIGYYFLHLACALERADSIADALAAVEQAFRAKSYPDLELFAFLRRGQLRIKQGQAELAEVDLRRAIALAQKIDAKAAQLRATISLARLFETQGRPDEARSMLAEIYTWFSEGFDVADLKNARALLEQLNV